MTVDVRSAPLPAVLPGGVPLPTFTSFDKIELPDVRTPGKPPIGFQGSDGARNIHKERSNAAYRAMQGDIIADDKGMMKAKERTGDRSKAWVWPYSQYVAGAMDRALVTGDVGEAKKALDGAQEYMLKDGSFNASPNKSGDRYYDDNAWIGLDMIQGFKLTGEQKYIDSARKVYDFLMQGMQPDGGMKWHEHDEPTHRPAASQGPALQLALQLYQLTGEQKYMDTAKKLDSFMDKLRTGPNGMVIDKVIDDGTGKNNDGSIFSYNQGTPIGTDVQFYEISGGKDKAKLDRAKNLANRTLDWFDDAKLYGHSPTFNAILVRNLLQLDRVLPAGDPLKGRIRPTIQRYLDHADRSSRTNEGWYRGGGLGKTNDKTPDGQTALNDQSAFVQIHALMAMTPEQLKSVS